MKARFSPNIGRAGRFLRLIISLLLFVAAGFAWNVAWWMSIALGIAGAFVLFEALRGWCALRACGIKTRW